MNLRGKKVAVVGLGRSGIAACSLLAAKGARVSISDCLDSPEVRETIVKLRSKRNIAGIETGRHTEELLKQQDLVVTSPGVPLDSAPISWARKRGIPVIGEIELAFSFCPCPIIAITGTNGKTTVAALTGEIFKAAGRKCIVCGNIGNPFSSEIAHLTSEHIVVLEISSFQLESIDKFKPKTAVVLNLSNDHLDRHKDFDEYLAAKCRIFSNQGEEDWAVLNKEDAYSPICAQKTKAKIVYFSRDLEKRFNQFNNNHFAALAIVSLFTVPEEIALESCLRFKGLEHRMEEIGRIRGVRFINDSKATNVDSTLWALNSITEPVVLIAGGKDKGSNFAAVRERLKDKVRAMVLFGQAGEKIEEAFGGLFETKLTATLVQALEQAFCLARSGDCVLFSPMCASFDMFSNYAERGKAFKEAVNSLKNHLQFR